MPSTPKSPTKETFLEAVKDHQIKIIKDDGLYRHIRFINPKDCAYYFDLITWPMHLAITGDMGSSTFCRVEDMFTFFRRDDDDLIINVGYWTEKMQAGSDQGWKSYSKDLFREAVKNDFDMSMDGSDFSEEKKKELWETVKDEVLFHADDEPGEAIRAAIDFFEHPDINFSDFWEHDLEEYTFQHIWRLYAIAWGIKKYDEYKRNDITNKNPEEEKNA